MHRRQLRIRHYLVEEANSLQVQEGDFISFCRELNKGTKLCTNGFSVVYKEDLLRGW